MFAASMLVLWSVAHAGPGINAILGDTSWYATHGDRPIGTEIQRIQTHLLYVERTLRRSAKPDPDRKREFVLDALAAYRVAGRFPRRGVDGYGDRRPQFIDDRGVPCAVGALLIATGYETLAHRIDEEYEFDYLLDIDDPELADWADQHGMTLEELAMIQPGYSAPPTRKSTESALRRMADAVALECARNYPPESMIRLHVTGDSYGQASVKGSNQTEFQRCVLKGLGGVEPGGDAYDGPVIPYRFSLRLPLASPQAQLAQQVAELYLSPANTGCPATNAPPRRAQVDAKARNDELQVEVKTSPRDAALERCLADYVTRQIERFGNGRWDLHTAQSVPLPPLVQADDAAMRLGRSANVAMVQCQSSAPRFTTVQLMDSLNGAPTR